MIQPQRLLDTFLSYVRIDSESTREGAMARRLADDLSAIGCQVYVDGSAAQTGSQTGNLYCTLPATGPGEPVLAASGGISDANSFNTHGIAALVLGTGMSKVHTTQEEITVKDLEDTAALVLALITG